MADEKLAPPGLGEERERVGAEPDNLTLERDLLAKIELRLAFKTGAPEEGEEEEEEGEAEEGEEEAREEERGGGGEAEVDDVRVGGRGGGEGDPVESGEEEIFKFSR